MFSKEEDEDGEGKQAPPSRRPPDKRIFSPLSSGRETPAANRCPLRTFASSPVVPESQFVGEINSAL